LYDLSRAIGADRNSSNALLRQSDSLHCTEGPLRNRLADRWLHRYATVTFGLQDIIAIPTSVRTKEQAEGLGIPLTTLDEHPEIDVAIDGADTVDNKTLALVKGGGGALLREK
jgi:Ribose 5-phosphate isomerase A (phosphoriboisomerase A)